MFDKMFEDFKSQFEEWAKSGFEQLGKELNDRFGVPEADGDFVLFRQFNISEPLISQGCIAIEDNSWRIEAYNSEQQVDVFNNLFNTSSSPEKPVRSVKLFMFGEPNTEECILCCRAWLKTSSITKAAKLRLGFESQVEFFGLPGGKITRYHEASILGSQWQEYEIRHHFKKEQYPASFWLNLDIFDSGTIWIKNIRLLQASVGTK